MHERDFFGLQFQTWSGVDVKISAAEGTYKLGRATPRWLMLNEPALAQLGDPIERDDGWAVWEFDCKVRFYLSPMITDNWDKFTRYPFLVPSLILKSVIFWPCLVFLFTLLSFKISLLYATSRRYCPATVSR